MEQMLKNWDCTDQAYKDWHDAYPTNADKQAYDKVIPELINKA